MEVNLTSTQIDKRCTSMNTGTMGIPDTPASLHACSKVGGVGIGGAAGAVGGYSPMGLLVENGGSSCMNIPIVWKVGSAIAPQIMFRFLDSSWMSELMFSKC